MTKDLILQHKKEKESLLKKKYIMRETLASSKKILRTDLIKVIVGPRRAGKSVYSTLLLENEDFAYLNFDDENLLKIEDTDEIIKGITEVYPDSKYIFFDEIQNLKNWELFVNKLHRRGYNLLITGSNANLLSKELATALTGRHIPIKLFPFNFREFLKAKSFTYEKKEMVLPEIKGKVLNLLDKYLENGGYPEVVVKNLDTKTYLEPLFDSILLKDVVKRYRVKFSNEIYNLSLYLLNNFSSEFSFTKLKNIVGTGSVTTIQNYVRYLSETYLILPMNRFNFKVKEQIKAPKKVYLIDNGFIQAKSIQSSQSIGKKMENLIFAELVKRGYEPNKNLFYYRTRNQKEIDFILKEGVKVKTLMQSFYSAHDLNSEKREINALIEASEELNCNNLLVITWDLEKRLKINRKFIKFLPLWKWLLEI